MDGARWAGRRKDVRGGPMVRTWLTSYGRVLSRGWKRFPCIFYLPLWLWKAEVAAESPAWKQGDQWMGIGISWQSALVTRWAGERCLDTWYILKM